MRSLYLGALLLALAGCDADLAGLQTTSCADFASKALECNPGLGSKSTWESTCASRGLTQACRACVVQSLCGSVATGCASACGQTNPFAPTGSGSGSGSTTGTSSGTHGGTSGSSSSTTSSGTSGATGTSGSLTGCSRVTVTALCDDPQPVSCGDTGTPCPQEDCPTPQGCACPSNAVCGSNSCSCATGYKLADCGTGSITTIGDYGTWWCHPYGPQHQPGCSSSLYAVGGTCTCKDGFNIPLSCSSPSGSTCQQLCLSAGH